MVFSISTVLIKHRSPVMKFLLAFDDFRANRLIVANRLAAERGIDVNNSNIDADGYPLVWENQTYYCPLLWLPIPEVMRRGFYGILKRTYRTGR
jgi:hypothetical protein